MAAVTKKSVTQTCATSRFSAVGAERGAEPAEILTVGLVDRAHLRCGVLSKRLSVFRNALVAATNCSEASANSKPNWSTELPHTHYSNQNLLVKVDAVGAVSVGRQSQVSGLVDGHVNAGGWGWNTKMRSSAS